MVIYAGSYAETTVEVLPLYVETSTYITSITPVPADRVQGQEIVIRGEVLQAPPGGMGPGVPAGQAVNFTDYDEPALDASTVTGTGGFFEFRVTPTIAKTHRIRVTFPEQSDVSGLGVLGGSAASGVVRMGDVNLGVLAIIVATAYFLTRD